MLNSLLGDNNKKNEQNGSIATKSMANQTDKQSTRNGQRINKE